MPEREGLGQSLQEALEQSLQYGATDKPLPNIMKFEDLMNQNGRCPPEGHLSLFTTFLLFSLPHPRPFSPHLGKFEETPVSRTSHTGQAVCHDN